MNTQTCFAAVRADNGKPIELAMQRLWLTGRLLPAGAHLTVQHIFRSQEEGPLEVVYAFSLPRDAALRAFRITGTGFEVHSELKPTEDAIKAYETGIAGGSLAALARQHGDGVVNLSVGNIRPGETVTVLMELLAGVELRDSGFRFRFPFTLAPNYHARMRAARIAPGVGELELPADAFGDVLLPAWHDDASGLHEVGFALTAPEGRNLGSIASPSHAIRVQLAGSGPAQISLAPERDVPDRDLVLDVEFRDQASQVMAGAVEGGKRSFAAILPSTAFGLSTNSPRRVVFLLDRSGSMAGAPITQARNAVAACLATLSAEDQFALVAFDDRVECMTEVLLGGSLENRSNARKFLEQVEARGGTQLASGFEKAASLLGGSGDLLILTDGQVAGTEEILSRARALEIRLSCLGIGSASQDRFLTLLARETGGVSRFAAPNERVDLAAVDLFASLGRPVATGLKTSGGVSVAPEPGRAVFAGSPVLLFGEASESDPFLELEWDSGRLSLPIPASNVSIGKTIRYLQGSRLITDWESRYPAREALATLEKRQQGRVAARLRSLSEIYGLASREMSLVAVVKRDGDAAELLPVTRVVPLGLPRGMEFNSIFGGGFTGGAGRMSLFGSSSPAPVPAAPRASFAKTERGSGTSEVIQLFTGLFSQKVAKSKTGAAEDILIQIAAQLEPDGGMPGDDDQQRAAKTIAALYAMIAAGHTLQSGAFRAHVARLVAFLKSVAGLKGKEKIAVERAIESASTGHAPSGDWPKIARQKMVSWREVAGKS